MLTSQNTDFQSLKRATVVHQTLLDMRKADHQRVHELRLLIEKEEDHIKCRQLIKELIDILERNEEESGDKTTS